MSVQSFKKMALVGMLLVPGLLMAQEVSSWETSPAAAPAAAPASTESAPVATQPSDSGVVAPVSAQQNNVIVAAPAVEQSASTNPYEVSYASGKRIQTIGRVMSWGGLVLGSLGSLQGNTTLLTVGGLVTSVGIPMNGWGSYRMVSSINEINPRARVEHRGWIPYGIGIGLSLYGSYALTNGVEDYQDATDKIDIMDSYGSGWGGTEWDAEYSRQEDKQEKAAKQIVTGVVTYIVGGVCMYVAWYKFSASADDANFAHDSIKLGVAPLLVPEKEGTGFAKGMQLTAAF